jgi:hypothetical protein
MFRFCPIHDLGWVSFKPTTEAYQTCYSIDGHCFEGTYNASTSCGHGIVRFSNGVATFEGEFDLDCCFGRFCLTDGSIYVGSSYHGLRHGDGIWSSGEIIISGRWVHGVLNGHGVVNTPTFSYEGGLRNNMKHGYGTIDYKGHIFTGMWDNDRIHGRGMITIKNKNVTFVGFWQNDEIYMVYLPETRDFTELQWFLKRNEDGANEICYLEPTTKLMFDKDGYILDKKEANAAWPNSSYQLCNNLDWNFDSSWESSVSTILIDQNGIESIV